MPFADIDTSNGANIRKGLRVAVFVAPYSTAAITTIMASGDLATIPAEHRMLGRTTEDGVTQPRETELSEIYSHGFPEPARSDIRRASKRLTVVAQETNIVALEQYQGISLAAVTTSAALDGNNESTWDEPSLPVYAYQRLLCIAMDITDSGEHYRGVYFPRCRVTEVGEVTSADADTPEQRSLTYTAFFDEPLGTSIRHFLAGPGRDPAAEGFPAPA